LRVNAPVNQATVGSDQKVIIHRGLLEDSARLARRQAVLERTPVIKMLVADER
jgi:hypothetical protein